MTSPSYPPVNELSRIGEYPANVAAGGGYVWDEVLEYRVWMHPERGAPAEWCRQSINLLRAKANAMLYALPEEIVNA